MEIVTRNVNSLFSDMLWRFKTSGVEAESRNGKVIRIDEPVLTTIKKPKERVLFFGERDSNPIFHTMESIWLLAGRRDVAFLNQFNSSIGNYSDDGEVFNAAYGFRTRNHFGFDQLKSVISILSKDKESRQCVIQLWDPEDLNKQTLDKCCNMQLVFSIKKEKLDLLIMNRSNDAIWGYAGANPVHFSILQELIAAAVEKPMGVYRQFSNNYHLYTELPLAQNLMANLHTGNQLYQGTPMPLVNDDRGETWLDFVDDCETLFDGENFEKEFATQFVKLADQLSRAYVLRKRGKSYSWLMNKLPEDNDWVLAFQQWCDRRAA